MYFVVSTLCMSTLAVTSIIGNKLPSNVLTPSGPEGPVKLISNLFTQGWGFFTRDAREDQVKIAVLPPTSDRWTVIDQDGIMQAKYAFGLSRMSRAESIDINILFGATDENTPWTECPPATLSSCLEALSPETKVRVSPVIYEPICSSEVVLIRETPIPFAYRDLTRSKQTFATMLAVQCPGEHEN